MTFKEYCEIMQKEADSPRNKLFMRSILCSGNYPMSTKNNFSYEYTYLPSYFNFCEKYNLQQIAGTGNTFAQALNIMQLITDNTEYCGYSDLGPSNSEQILEYSFGKGFSGAINCANKSILLSDFLMSVNIKAIPVWITNHIMDSESEHFGCGTCHAVVHVYIPESRKWIMLDPSFNAYLTDDQYNVLNLIEISDLYKKEQQIHVRQYSFDGNSELFRQTYLMQFIINTLLTISIWGGNEYKKRSLGLDQYYLIPENIDLIKYLKDININDNVADDQKKHITQYIENLKHISANELLAKPQ